MTVFPTTSTHVTEVQAGKYDIAQLSREIKARIDAGALARQELPDDNLFHLHTLTIDVTLAPPKAQITYPRRAAEPNPEYAAYLDARDTIATSIDPLVPLTLLHPTRRMTHHPYRDSTASNRRPASSTESVAVLLPTSHPSKPLITLAPLPKDAGKEWSQSKSWDLEHWLQTAIALDPEERLPVTYRRAIYRDDKQRFHLETSIAAMWLPGETGGTDFKLLITVDVRVDLDAVLVSLPDVGDDMVGLILHSLMPSSTASTYLTPLNARATALRRFFDCLSPAPDHPLGFNARQLQPKEMLCKLYPFQARTVGLLLRRENAPIMGEPSRPAIDPPGFWSAADLGEEKVAYRRVTGSLVRLGQPINRKGKARAIEEDDDEEQAYGLNAVEVNSLPTVLDLSAVRGTMLCEEMGLGKTVEAIALALLHRHPLSVPRSLASSASGNAYPVDEAVPVIDLGAGIPGLDDPDIASWLEAEKESFHGKTIYDEQAQLNVTEVAATLIITPPALLQQWVAEIRRHCPTMRVCVYEGWKSLQKAIERQRADNVRAVREALESRKRKSSASFRAKTVKKYKKLNGDASVKVESDEEEEEEEEPMVQSVSSLEICQREFVEYVQAHDVVLATYSDLGADLAVALPAPARSRRSNANYQLGERPRSPLLMVEWWRVIMDEVQLQGDTSDAANMVSLVPRVNSLAMSGTPARTDIKDLMGSLRFLRVPLLPNDSRLWYRLQQPSMRQAFEGIFRELSVRTTKREVAGEFSLPHQSRLVVPIDLSEIEITYYNDTLARQRDLLGLPDELDERRPEDWVLDRTLFRNSLKTLRQICTHLQVGHMVQAGPRGNRLQLGRDLVTMGQALEKMRDDQSQAIMLESRNQMRQMIRKAQLMILEDDEKTRDRRLLAALTLYQSARDKVTRQIGPVRDHLQKLLDDRERAGGDNEDIEGTPSRTLSQHDRQRVLALQLALSSIREMLIIQHETWFFEGDVHHMMKQEDKEVECYARADQVRKEILARPLGRANESVDLLTRSEDRSQAITSVADLQSPHTNMRGGLLTAAIANSANELLKIMNGNAELVFNWRSKIIELLSSPIEAEGAKEAERAQEPKVKTEEGVTESKEQTEEPEAEYYAQALQAQGDIESYLIAYAAAIADRREFLFEDRSTLAELDGRMKKQRTTQAARDARVDMIEEVEGDVAEQAGVLMKERQAFRAARKEKDCTRPLKGLVFDMNRKSIFEAVLTEAVIVGDSRAEEKLIAKDIGNKLKAFMAAQKIYCDKLDKELELFREVFNRRLKYFAALQEISDSVTAPTFKDLQLEIQEAQDKINELEVKLTRMVVHGRYLQYLGDKGHINAEEAREDCIICMGSSDDTKAVLLECGHFFCQSCFREFRRSQGGRKCPSCREEINDRAIKVIKLSDSEEPEDGAGEGAGGDGGGDDASANANMGSAEAARLRSLADLEKIHFMDVERRREVQQLDMMGEYGSKIDFLIKHLLWYKAKEPDARHVIFSNWFDSINIVMRALTNNRIRFVSLDQAQKKKNAVDEFKKNKDITVFLLHAERESAGLTLTTCRVVHLLEPVLRHSFELQAIGRVDRLGQDKETTVYCYATRDTVEAKILSQGVRNGTSIYLKDQTADEVVAEMPNVASAANKGGDLVNDGNEEELLKLIM